MPYVGNSVTVRPKADCDKSYDFVRKAGLIFFLQNALASPNADTYVKKLFAEAPQAKDAVKGKLAVVTGVTIGGAGYHMAEELAVQAGMHVILMGRSEGKLKDAIASIVKNADSRKTDMPTLYETKYDLNSLKSAKSAADFVIDLAKDKYDGKLHVLINNAGGVAPEAGLTEEGIETNVGRNYVCPHYLTELLIPALKAAATAEYKPRVVHVASIGHVVGNDFDPARLLDKPTEGGAPDGVFEKAEWGEGIKYAKEGDAMASATQYGRSKMGLVADAVHLATLHPELNFTSQQPGSIISNFGSNMGFAGTFYYYGFYFFNYSASQGARTALRAALDPDFNTEKDLQGAYLHSDGNPWTPCYPAIKDPGTGEKYRMDDYGTACWESTEKLIGKVTAK